MKSFTSHFQSAAKALSWRAVSVLEGLTIAYLVTGSFKSAASLMTASAITGTILFYFHERAWNLARVTVRA